MIMRITAKLGKKIGISPKVALPAEPNPYTDWTANIFRAPRTEYIVLTNTHSLYSVIMPGAGITNEGAFVKRAFSYLSELLINDGDEFVLKRLVAPAFASVSFSKNINRAVIGSMNDLVLLAKYMLMEGELPLLELSFKLNMAPMSYLKHKRPRDVFSSMGIELEHSRE